MSRFVVLVFTALLVACASPSPSPKPECTWEKADSMSDKLKQWVVEEMDRMPDASGASYEELQAGLARVQAMVGRVEVLHDLAVAKDLDGVCRETRRFAADYGFSVE